MSDAPARLTGDRVLRAAVRAADEELVPLLAPHDGRPTGHRAGRPGRLAARAP